MTMADFLALLLTIILMRVSVRAADTIPELSFTMGEDAIIPCDYGEGTLRNIYWHYNNGTGNQSILRLFKSDLLIETAYTNRAYLLKDNSTLVLKDIRVEDEGTYCCDVDRQDQTGVFNIYTKLNVFGLSPNSLPVVPQCTEGEKSSCAVNASASFNLTCELRNIYPVKDAKLNWNHDGQYIPTSNDSMENEDGTFDMIRRIEVAGTGNFTCHATFLSANGTENTAVPVSVCITPDVQNSPGKNLTGGAIAGIVIGCIVLPVAVLVIVVLYTRKNQKRRKNYNHDDEEAQVPLNDGKTDLVEESKLLLLAKKFPTNKFDLLSNALGTDYNEAHSILDKCGNNCQKALKEILMEWKTRTGGHRAVLAAALEKAEVGGLVRIIAGTTRESGQKNTSSSPMQ